MSKSIHALGRACVVEPWRLAKIHALGENPWRLVKILCRRSMLSAAPTPHRVVGDAQELRDKYGIEVEEEGGGFVCLDGSTKFRDLKKRMKSGIDGVQKSPSSDLKKRVKGGIDRCHTVVLTVAAPSRKKE